MSLDPQREIERVQLSKLLGKLVFRAICDVVNYRDSVGKRREIYDSAYRWMFIEDGYDSDLVEDNEEMERTLRGYDQLMSFENICGTLGWDPDRIRARTRALSKEDLRRVIKRNGLT